ncbi:polysaccharide biosynthesis protein [Candidatus Pelagibacter sp.]|nr:polysaccharide biosynthesis protein [Candidatus Pelagibacter sp.]
MIKTYIIGTGYLSSKLSKKIKNSEVISADIFLKQISKINSKSDKFNIIINAFYSSKKLHNIKSYKLFIKKSLLDIASIFDVINSSLINKILYTSSSSIYGSINNYKIFKDENNRYIYSSLKISAENLIKNFCVKNQIYFDICRVFNLYGLNDNFSIISKLISSRRKRKKISIYNQGNSIRDFIHVDDIVSIYKELLKKKTSNVFDIGTGYGTRIRDIIIGLNYPKKLILYNKTQNSELLKSIANNNNLLKQIKFNNFKKLESFLKIKKIKYQKNSDHFNYLENTLIGSVIYGAGYSGKELYKQFSRYDENVISYFVDDDPKKIGKNINGIKILSFLELQKLSLNTQIRNIIIAIPSLKKNELSNLFKKILPLTNHISSLPEKSFYKNSKINIQDVNNITIEEILEKKISDHKKEDFKFYKNKSILVTGGAGSIGSEIVQQLLKAKIKNIIILDNSELNIYRFNQKINSKKIRIILGNIQDFYLVKSIINDYKINHIFHTAAYKHVKFLENNVHAALKNNIIGTLSIIKAIQNKKVHLSFISTDKAFDPKTVLGISKRIGEVLINYYSNNKDFIKSNFNIVRFGNVIGSHGSALPYFLNQIKKDLPISLTDIRMERYFMTIQEACELVLKSTQLNTKNKILFLDMGKPLKIIDIIKKIFFIIKKPNQKLKLKFIGNKFNEKIREKLYFKNKYNQTKFKKIYFVKEKKITKEKINSLIEYLEDEKIIFDSKKLIYFLKKFI